MRDEQLDAAIDEVAHELTRGREPGDLKVRVLAQIESPAVRLQSWRWGVAVPVAAIAIVGAAVAIFRGGGRQQTQPTPQGQPTAPRAQPGAARSLAWVDRQGREEPVGPSRAYMSVRLSPDGTRAAVDIRVQTANNELGIQEHDDVWIWDLGRRTISRLTFNVASSRRPIWTPDGQRIVFTSPRGGAPNLFWQAAGPGAPERLTTNPNSQVPQSFSPDGQTLVFQEQTAETGADLYLLRLDSQLRTEPLVQTRFADADGEVSPDGRWLAYRSNESGRNEIYARPFPSGVGRWQVSPDGGTVTRWSRNGRELFYVDRGKVMAVSVTTGPASFMASRPTELFEGPYADNFDVAPDGQRFLMIKDR